MTLIIAVYPLYINLKIYNNFFVNNMAAVMFH